MKAGDTITIARRAIYASSTCSEREFERTVVECTEIEGQNAAIITLKSKSGSTIKGRLEGGYIHVSYPRAAKYEVLS